MLTITGNTATDALHENFLNDLFVKFEYKTYAPGETLVHFSDRADRLIFIVSGKVQVHFEHDVHHRYVDLSLPHPSTSLFPVFPLLLFLTPYSPSMPALSLSSWHSFSLSNSGEFAFPLFLPLLPSFPSPFRHCLFPSPALACPLPITFSPSPSPSPFPFPGFT